MFEGGGEEEAGVSLGVISRGEGRGEAGICLGG